MRIGVNLPGPFWVSFRFGGGGCLVALFTLAIQLLVVTAWLAVCLVMLLVQLIGLAFDAVAKIVARRRAEKLAREAKARAMTRPERALPTGTPRARRVPAAGLPKRELDVRQHHPAPQARPGVPGQPPLGRLVQPPKP